MTYITKSFSFFISSYFSNKGLIQLFDEKDPSTVMESTDIFLKRYNKHIQTPGFGVPGQDSLTNARVLVVGLSPIASPVISYLSSSGAGTIGVISNEMIESEDLPSSPLFFSSTEGKSKGQTAIRQARDINPQIKLNLIESGLDAAALETALLDYDLIIDCENDLRRTLLMDNISKKAGKPMVWASLKHPVAFISVFNYKGSGSYRSLIADKKINSLIDLERSPGLSTLAAIAGSLVANEAVKIIAEIGDIAANRLLAFNILENKLDVINFEATEENDTTANDYVSILLESEKHKVSTYRAISPQQLQTKINYKEPLQLVDIRPQINEDLKDWNYLHIPEAELSKKAGELHQDITVILISDNGESAERFCMKLNEERGFDNIFYLEGGLKRWQKEMNASEIKYESF